jgi:hypothetical protein
MNIENIEKELGDMVDKDIGKRPIFTGTGPAKATPAMAKATTIVQLNDTIEGLQKNIDEMTSMIRVIEEIKKRLV